jgi:hypothetical protein
MPVEPESDLHWKAFLYVSGDLPADESEAFESCLLEDQSARDAVTSAVELIQVVGLLGREERVPVRSRRTILRRRRAIWGVVLSAAAVLLGAVLLPDLSSASRSESDVSAVALAWSGLRGGIEADWTAVVSGAADVGSTDPAQAVDLETGTEASTERPLPSWLLSAASVRRSEASSEEN